jgi:hypothetical protein
MFMKEQKGNTDSGYDEAWQVIRYGTLRVTFSPSFKVHRILNEKLKLSEKRLNVRVSVLVNLLRNDLH